ncbi:MAG: YSC84-related protein [Bacteroidota bacterium]
MKKYGMMGMAVLLSAALSLPAIAGKDSKEKMLMDAQKAKSALIKGDAGLANLFRTAYGYVIFPNIGKGGLGVGGAGGKGTLYESGNPVGWAKMVQITVGAQAGGQAYREVIFFETRDALQRFKEGNLEMSGQMSAVAVNAGASANAKYSDGVLIFTQTRGGLMAEASVGGQKFTYTAF